MGAVGVGGEECDTSRAGRAEQLEPLELSLVGHGSQEFLGAEPEADEAGHQLVVSTLGGGGGGGGGQRAWRSDKGCRRLKRDDEGTSCVEPSSPATAKEECKGAMSSRRVTIHGLKVDGVGPAARRRTTEGRMPTGGGDSALGQEAGGEQECVGPRRQRRRCSHRGPRVRAWAATKAALRSGAARLGTLAPHIGTPHWHPHWHPTLLAPHIGTHIGTPHWHSGTPQAPHIGTPSISSTSNLRFMPVRVLVANTWLEANIE